MNTRTKIIIAASTVVVGGGLYWLHRKINKGLTNPATRQQNINSIKDSMVWVASVNDFTPSQTNQIMTIVNTMSDAEISDFNNYLFLVKFNPDSITDDWKNRIALLISKYNLTPFFG